MKKALKSKQQSGFTLIELVVVIVVLGILAATAVPRFADISKEARYSAAKGLYAGVQSAAALAHAQALAQGKTGATGVITMEGQDINLVYGYPAAATAAAPAAGGIDLALSSLTGFTYAELIGIGTFSQTGTTACGVTYKAATATTPPEIKLVPTDADYLTKC